LLAKKKCCDAGDGRRERVLTLDRLTLTSASTNRMDLLGSILGSMSAPPSLSEKEKERRKKAKEMADKAEEAQRKAHKLFREKTEAKVKAFVEQSKERTLTCPPMEKALRSIVHDVAEVAGLVAHSFGHEDDESRHVVIWKREDAPGEDELECLRAGEEWNPQVAERRRREREERDVAERQAERERKATEKSFVPKSGHYQAKYEHLIGKESALDAARRTELKKSYGMVSAESKRDKRTVEDIQKEIREKKRAKLEGEHEGDEPGTK